MRALGWVLPLLSLVACALLAASPFGPARLEDELRWGSLVIGAPFLIWAARQAWRDHKAGVSFANRGPVDPNDRFIEGFAAKPKLAIAAYAVAVLVFFIGFATMLIRTVRDIQEPGLRWTVGGVLAVVLIALAVATVREDRGND